MNSLNSGETICGFEGNHVSEFGIGCVQVADAPKPTTTKGMLFADAGEWKVQGRGGSRPIKSSRVNKTVSEDTARSAGGTLAASNEKPAWINNPTTKGLPLKAQAAIKKEMGALRKAGVFEPLKKVVKLTLSKNAVVAKSIKKARPTLNKKGPILVNGPGGRFSLMWWKCYLNSCVSYHSFFMQKFLRDVREGKSTMEGSCNAGTVLTNTKGWYGDFEVWLNKKGFANLLPIPMLEAAGYLVSTHTHGNWVVTSPKEKKIVFKEDTGVCNRMSYIDLRDNQEGIAMIKTVRKRFAGAIKREIEKAYIVRTVQHRIGHPPEGRFKAIVSLGENGLRNCPVTVSDVSNALDKFWTNLHKDSGDGGYKGY